MAEKTIMEVWKLVYPSLADCILFVMSFGIVWWFRNAIKNTIHQFTVELKAVTLLISTNSDTVREHLDAYNATHEKSWTSLAELVQELKDKKVWQNEYLLEIRNVEERHQRNRQDIEKLDERVKCLERQRRRENGEKVG